MTAGVLTGAVTPAAALTDVVTTDARGDAHRALDITRVEVSHTSRLVRIDVKVRDYAGMDSGARVGTALGVHFDTKGDSRPEHLIRIDGMHTAAGSTRAWNQMRSNGMDPWGDWLSCYPGGWDKPLIQAQPATNTVVFRAPRSCLGNPASVRVAVQSYKPYRSTVTADWVKGTRRYLPRAALD